MPKPQQPELRTFMEKRLKCVLPRAYELALVQRRGCQPRVLEVCTVAQGLHESSAPMNPATYTQSVLHNFWGHLVVTLS
jgi:hypothetical protein